MSDGKHTSTTSRKRVGPFTVSGVIGEGGMGTVLRCHRKGEDVAVKMIRPNLLGSDDIRARFAREAELLKSVDHPNVARIVGYDADNKTSPWLATEFIDGPNLKEWVAEHGAMGEASWDELAEGIFSGLAAIHDTGILHRDIKPANIMLSPDGAKIIDFGISKEEGQTALTNTQMFAGTVAYLAPERVETNEESQASDMFSAGLVLAVAARGEHPWGDETTQTELAILMNMANEEPRLDGLSDKQQKVLRALLRRNPEARPVARDALAILRGELQPARDNDAPLVRAKKRSLQYQPTTRDFTAQTTGSIIRGASLAVVAFLATTLIGLMASSGRGGELLANGISWSTTALANALRVQPTSTDFSWLLSSEANLATSLAIRPTLITLGLMVVMGLFGRKYAQHVPDMSRRDRVIRLSALLLPTIILVVGLSWLVPDTAGMMPWDVLFGVAVLGVGLAIGLAIGGLAHEHSPVSWWLRAAGTFSVLALTVSFAILVGGIIHGLLTPDLAPSTATSTASPLGELSLSEVFVFAITAALIAPTVLIVAVDGFLSGQGYASLREENFVYLQVLAETSGANQLIWLTPQSAILSGLFVALLLILALAAGAHTAGTRQLTVAGARWFIQLAIVTVTAALLVFALLRVAVDSTPALRGTLFLHTSLPHTLVLLGIMAAGAVAVASLIWLGGHRQLAHRLAPFIPGLGPTPSAELIPAGRAKRVSLPRVVSLSAVAITAVITLVIPPSLGLVERGWASTNTPEKAVSELALAMEIRDGDGLIELMPLAEGTSWLPIDALESAQPIIGQRRHIRITNNQGETWSLGQLDAAGSITWPGSDGTVAWQMDVPSTVERRFIFMRHVHYQPALEPITLSLGADQRFGSISGAPIRINGVEVTPGEYSLIPGNYTVQRDPIDLLAGFSEQFVVSSPSHAVQVTADLNLPADGERQLSAAATEAVDSCGNVSRSECFSQDDVYQAQQIRSGRIPADFYASESSAFEDGGLRCEEGQDIMLSTKEVVREVVCTQTVRYETQYWDSRRIAEPVYSTRCASWWYSWWFGATCLRWERYQSGTNYRTVRGDLIDTVRYQSDIPIRVSVPAALDDSGQFVVGEPQISQ